MRNGTALKLVVAGFVAVLAAGCSGSVPARKMFTDITRQAGVELWGQGKCVAFEDIDGDGYLDLYVCLMYEPSRMFHNNKDRTFYDITQRAGVGGPPDSYGAVFADFNNDGRVDLLVTSNSEFSSSRTNRWEPNHLYIQMNDVAFIDCGKRSGINNTGGRQNRSCGVAAGDVDNDGDLDVYVTRGSYRAFPNFFFRNEEIILDKRTGIGFPRFAESADLAGVSDSGQGHACAFADVDNDGYLDLFIGNVFRPKQESAGLCRLFRNNGKGAFTDVTAKSGIDFEAVARRNKHAEFIIDCAFADIDNDGDLDLFISNGGGENALYRNDGNMTFTDITKAAGVKGLGAGNRGCMFGDIDNDGHLDLYVAGVKDALYRNNGDGTFTDITASSGLNVPCGHGCAFGDIDNDGGLDLYVSSWGLPQTKPEWKGSGYFRLYRNNIRKRCNYLKVLVKGGKGRTNLSGVGAKVYVYDAGHCGDGKYLIGFREVNAGSGMFHCNTLEQHFGLGKRRTCDLKIVFPATKKEVKKMGVSVNQKLQVGEPK